MAFAIRLDDLCSEAVHALLREHLAGVALHSPPESIHALDLDGLRAPGMSFWTLWDGEALVACGALKELDREHGEVKSMRTAAAHLRKGAARAMLGHIVAEARRRGYRRLSLETGTAAAFEPAHRLYASAGFSPCGPFAAYVDDPYSCFMMLEL
ncbi:GNAT family N-acetyltransferase [Dyella ginsengisoli]|uniref:GNAT family N-acetyltransferase n=1 Tax=Dyella ginsengisoli TaxID=363848 RepID=A0ABW8JRU3_9GAMM